MMNSTQLRADASTSTRCQSTQTPNVFTKPLKMSLLPLVLVLSGCCAALTGCLEKTGNFEATEGVVVGGDTTTGGSTSVVGVADIPDVPPMYDKWADDAEYFGQMWGQRQDPATTNYDNRYGAYYYDLALNMYQIGDFLGQAEPWNTYAEMAVATYRNEFLGNANFAVPGYWVFPHGLYENFKRGGIVTINDLRQLRDRPALSKVLEYTRGGSLDGNCENVSREMAYALQTNIAAEKAGEPRMIENGEPRVQRFVEWMEAHFYQWKTGGHRFQDTACDPSLYRFAPFMAGLSMNALIEFYDWEVANGRDPEAYWRGMHWPSMIDMLSDFLVWMERDSVVRMGPTTGERMWIQQTNLYGVYRYEDRNATGTLGWELGNLIAPAYAWLALQYSNSSSPDDINFAVQLINAADANFAGTVSQAWIEGGGKFFNQVYRVSFDYFGWRQQALENLRQN